MNNDQQKLQNDLAFKLHRELLKTAEKFCRKCPKASAEAILGAGNAYIAGFLVSNAPTKQHALDTLESCYQTMRQMIEITPSTFFGNKIN